MMMRRVGVVMVLVAALTMMNAGIAWAAKGGTDRPIHCEAIGSATYDANVNLFVGDYTKASRCTHLGVITDHFTSARTSEIWVAANGDELISVGQHDSIVQIGPNTYYFKGHNTIVGGTGRFAGATGSLAWEGPETYVFPSGQPVFYTFDLTFDGTISY